jgi:hypothetical protein
MDLTLPHGAGISGKKKGPENIRALVNGGAEATPRGLIRLPLVIISYNG